MVQYPELQSRVYLSCFNPTFNFAIVYEYVPILFCFATFPFSSDITDAWHKSRTKSSTAITQSDMSPMQPDTYFRLVTIKRTQQMVKDQA